MQEQIMEKKTGKFGAYGGQYVPETIMNALQELEAAFLKIHWDKEFNRELLSLQQEFAGRPTPLTFCRNISEELGCKVYLKREDLVHRGSHKLNNTLGQGLLAKHMGKRRLIAETGAG
jgi:tryptophan synthase beta chain